MNEQDNDTPPDTVRPSAMPPPHEDSDCETIPVPPPTPMTTDERLDQLENRLGRVEKRLDGVETSLKELRQDGHLCLNYVREIAEQLGVRARLQIVAEPVGAAKTTNGSGS